MKRLTALLLAAVLCLASTGCLEAHSLDRYGYVLGIGFDKGEKLPYKLTLMLQNNQSKQEGQQSGGFTLASAECRGLAEAINTLSGSLPYTLDFARTTMLVFERSVAEQPGAMDELLSVAFSRLRIRYNANVYVSLSTAQEALKGLKNEMEPSVSKLRTNLALYAEHTGLAPLMNLKMLMEGISTTCFDAVLPVCGVTKEGEEPEKPETVVPEDYPYVPGSMYIESEMKTGITGAAIFDGSRMAGLLDGQNAQLLMMANGDFVQGRMRFTDAQGEESSVYLKAKGTPKVALTLGEQPFAQVSIRLQAVIEQPEDLPAGQEPEVEAEMETHLTDALSRLFAACRACGSDAMGFGRSAIKQFGSAAAWEGYDWKSVYKRLNVAFSVDVELSQPAEKIGWE